MSTSVRPSRLRVEARHLRAGVGFCLVATPLALGGAHAPVNLPLALLLVTLLALAVMRREVRPAFNLPLLLCLAALAATLLQLVPVPMPLIALLSPGAHEVLSLDPERSWAPLTLDPPATCHELLKLAAYSAAALLGVGLYRDRGSRRRLAVVIAGSGTVVAFSGLLHALAGAKQPYGVFGYTAEHFTSTFINPNHLAGFLGFASFIGLGLAISAIGAWRFVHLAAAVLCGAGVILSLSRGGIIAYLSTILFFGAVQLLNRSRHGGKLLWLQLALAGVVVLAGYLAYTRIVHELWTLSRPDALSKTEIWQPVPQMLADFRALGVGRGAFSTVYPRYHQGPLPNTFTHLENEWLQPLVDWGPLAGGLLLAGALLAFSLLLRRSPKRPVALSLASGLLFLAVHNLGDFNLEVSGVALPAVLALAVFSGRHGRRDEAVEEPKSTVRSVYAARALTAALVVVTLAAAWPAIGFGLERDTERLAGLLREPAPGGGAPAQAAILARHPADYLLPALIAERELRRPGGARAALRWLNRSLFLAPQFSGSHRLVGRALLELGVRQQGLLEMRLACLNGPTESRSILSEVWSRGQKAGDLVALAESADPWLRQQAASFLMSKAQHEAVLSILGSEPPLADRDASRTAAQALFALKRHDEGLVRAQGMVSRWPEDPEGYLLQAQAQMNLGDRAAARDTLDLGMRTCGTLAQLLAMRAQLALADRELGLARTLARQLLERTGLGSASGGAHFLLAEVNRLEGRLAMALRELEQARDSDPGHLGYRLAIAAMRESLGDYRGATSELERAKNDLGNSPPLERARARLDEKGAAHEEGLRRRQLLGE